MCVLCVAMLNGQDIYIYTHLKRVNEKYDIMKYQILSEQGFHSDQTEREKK